MYMCMQKINFICGQELINLKCITILNLLHTTQKVNKEGLPLIIIPVYVHLIFTYNYLLSSIGPQSTATSHR